MKKRGLIIIGLVVIIMITATGCFSPKPWFLDFKKSHSVDEEEEIDLTDVDFEDLDLELLSSEVSISSGSSNEIIINLEGSIKSNFTPDIYIEERGKSLRITDSNKSFSDSDYKDNSLMIEIIVPEKFHRDISLNTITSRVEVKEIDFDEVNMNTVSGDLRVNEIKSTDANLKSVSGNIDLTNSNLYNLRVDTVSGDSKLIGVIIKDMRFKSVSGNLEIVGSLYSLDSDTVSGNADIDIEKVESDFNLKSVSGSTTISTGNVEGFNFRFSSLSGDVESDKDLNFDRIHDDTVEGSYGNGGSLIYFKSTSGDLIIK